ncbi:facilitated trehalose transporter Tret1 isoform X1 [Fopius arisanus]|uniref:Facilitated trehalose transporter Tret1 isoform X1 n=4 Tax=Fopius arisanus TaxID=64838 RepID=A0A9R1U6S0_9HYME|nr:PREDICTED: facilitated trehalose transporter Tret1-like isoform X1 [Fopius arisanus]
MSSQRRQMMQPWPLCIMPFSKPKERLVLPKYYSRVPTLTSSTTSSTLPEDCASNTTLLTNASPFNSQQALITDKGRGKSNNSYPSHYYAENLRHENEIKSSRIYNPLNKDLKEYTQLEPLVARDRLEIADAELPMGSQIQLEDKNNEPSSPSTPRAPKLRAKAIIIQVLAALTVSLGSMMVGFSSSYTSTALPSMNATAPFEIDEQISSWIGSILPLAALFGGIIGGPLIEYIGRRSTILVTAFPFIGAWLFIGLANNFWLVLVGRGICGLCVGITSLSLPVYLGETIQPEVRGTLGLLPTAFGNIGILICFIAGTYLNWSHLAFLGACLPVPFLLLMFLIPETPRWYISKGRMKRARKSLEWLRGKTGDVTEELSGIEKTHVESERNAGSQLNALLQPKNIKPLAISLGLMYFQQFSGINAIIFYTVEIFESAGNSEDSNKSTIIVGIVNFASTFIATALIDRLGRKILLYISSITMIVTLAILSVFFYFKENMYDMTSVWWLPLVGFIIYVIGFSLGFGPIPWLMMGEILPAKIRGPAASIATGFNWSCTFIVTKTFKDIIGLIGTSGTFLTFGVICILGLVFVIFVVPETRGRSLEEIERRLTGPVRRMSAIANMKPVPTGC